MGFGLRAHLPERIGTIVAEVADVDVIAGGEGELAPAEQVVRGGLLVLRAVAQPFAHELRREDATVVPAINPGVSGRRWACGAGLRSAQAKELIELVPRVALLQVAGGPGRSRLLHLHLVAHSLPFTWLRVHRCGLRRAVGEREGRGVNDADSLIRRLSKVGLFYLKKSNNLFVSSIKRETLVISS